MRGSERSRAASASQKIRLPPRPALGESLLMKRLLDCQYSNAAQLKTLVSTREIQS